METMADTARFSSVPLRNPPQIIPSSSQTLIAQRPVVVAERKQFPSYLETPDVSPKARIFCEILSRVSPPEVEAALSSTRIKPEPEIVEEVLKLSYGCPLATVGFFRWSGMIQKPSLYAWNLMVDLLGKNKMFEEMWDAIRAMKKEGLLTLATFVSAFGSYCNAGRIGEAIMTFDVMGKYGVEPDVVAVNSLLSAICREDNQTLKALEFFERIKTKISPDADSFAILLEGWEKEGNVTKAKNTFGEMVIRVGWSPQYMSAYDAFLNTLVRGSQVDEAIKFLQVMKGKSCLPGLKFFSTALDILVKQNDSAHAVLLWDTMASNGLVPNLIMYNAIIGLLCNNNDIDKAFYLFDEMILYGAFPDSLAYNTIFQCLIKNKKVRLASNFFTEMVKNECLPTHTNCAAAITMFFANDDPETATEIWDFMIKNNVLPLEVAANALLVGLSNLGRLTELRRSVENMFDRRINIYESTMSTMKIGFYKEGRSARDTYDSLSKKWKPS